MNNLLFITKLANIAKILNNEKEKWCYENFKQNNKIKYTISSSPSWN